MEITPHGINEKFITIGYDELIEISGDYSGLYKMEYRIYKFLEVEGFIDERWVYDPLPPWRKEGDEVKFWIRIDGTGYYRDDDDEDEVRWADWYIKSKKVNLDEFELHEV